MTEMEFFMIITEQMDIYVKIAINHKELMEFVLIITLALVQVVGKILDVQLEFALQHAKIMDIVLDLLINANVSTITLEHIAKLHLQHLQDQLHLQLLIQLLNRLLLLLLLQLQQDHLWQLLNQLLQLPLLLPLIQIHKFRHLLQQRKRQPLQVQ